MLKLRSSVAAWIFVLELGSLDLNGKTNPLSPPFLLSSSPVPLRKKTSPLLSLKPGQSCEGY